MIGAIAGDIIGSRFEHGQAANYDFELFHHHCRFTDDTVCSLAVAKALMDGESFSACLRRFARRYPNSGYQLPAYLPDLASDSIPYPSKFPSLKPPTYL